MQSPFCLSFVRIFRGRLSLWGLAFLCLPLVGELMASSRQESGAVVTNATAAVVDDRVITYGQIRQQMDRMVPAVRRMSRSEEEFRQRIQQLEGEILQSMIDRILVVKEFEKKGFQLPPGMVDAEIQGIVEDDFGGNRTAFLRHLESRGMTTRAFRQEVEEGLKLRIMRGRLRQTETMVSPVQMEEFYRENPHLFTEDEAVYLRMIELSAITSEPADILQQTADRIFTELEEGTSFSELAAKYSQHRNRADGGLLGWVAMSDLREDWQAAVRSLAPGEVSEMIEVGDSIFILYVEDRREGGVQPLYEVRDRIEEELVNRAARREQERWLERLRNRYFIRVFGLD